MSAVTGYPESWNKFKSVLIIQESRMHELKRQHKYMTTQCMMQQILEIVFLKI